VLALIAVVTGGAPWLVALLALQVRTTSAEARGAPAEGADVVVLWPVLKDLADRSWDYAARSGRPAATQDCCLGA